MSLDLETFLTTLYVITDDLHKDFVRPKMPNSGGPTPHLSDSEVLCLGLAAQWRSGVPWKTERGFVRYAQKHLRRFFPGMTSQSAFNRRLRRLWGAYILIQQAVANQLWSPQDCEIMDCAPIPIARGARSFHRGGWRTLPALARAVTTVTSMAYTCCWWLVPAVQPLAGPWPLATSRITG
ncbi:MAG: hypothetical protein HZY76_07985 [Anaerolineae bacterium]|nr:MAG: hypothetical protein HZY76_07985 [Anaerolineae bacterium]